MCRLPMYCFSTSYEPFFALLCEVELDLEATSPLAAGPMSDFANRLCSTNSIRHSSGRDILSWFLGGFLPSIPELPSACRKAGGSHLPVNFYYIVMDSFLRTNSKLLAAVGEFLCAPASGSTLQHPVSCSHTFSKAMNFSPVRVPLPSMFLRPCSS